MQHQFDTLAKAVAGGVSRRAALQRVCGGLTGALLGSLGLRSAAAQPDQAPSSLCLRAFEVTVRQGPSAGLHLQGVLALNVEASGSINQGSYRLMDGTVVKVTGQANGRAINLLFDLGNGRLLYGVGTLENNIEVCGGAMGGPFVGPLAGDSGDWAPLPQKLMDRAADTCSLCTQACIDVACTGDNKTTACGAACGRSCRKNSLCP